MKWKGSTQLAQSVEHTTLALQVLNSSPTLEVEITSNEKLLEYEMEESKCHGK